MFLINIVISFFFNYSPKSKSTISNAAHATYNSANERAGMLFPSTSFNCAVDKSTTIPVNPLPSPTKDVAVTLPVTSTEPVNECISSDVLPNLELPLSKRTDEDIIEILNCLALTAPNIVRSFVTNAEPLIIASP